MKIRMVALVQEEYWDWFSEAQQQNPGLFFAVKENSVIIDLEIFSRIGSQEIYLIPSWLMGVVDARINGWEYGCNGMAVVIANFISGGKLKPLRIKENGGMAMFSTTNGFASVTVMGKKRQRVEIVKHVIYMNGQRLFHLEQTVFKGKWRGRPCKKFSKYAEAVSVAMTRAQMKENPEYPLFV